MYTVWRIRIRRNWTLFVPVSQIQIQPRERAWCLVDGDKLHAFTPTTTNTYSLPPPPISSPFQLPSFLFSCQSFPSSSSSLHFFPGNPATPILIPSEYQKLSIFIPICYRNHQSVMTRFRCLHGLLTHGYLLALF
jgi:hypothetical protein